MGMHSSRSIRGYRLVELIDEIRAAVTDLATGKLTLALPTRGTGIRRYAPSFVQRRADERPTGVPYTASALGRYLGQVKESRGEANEVITAALLLLESEELGNLDRATLEEIAGGKFSLQEIKQMFAPKVLVDERETAAAASVLPPNPFSV